MATSQAAQALRGQVLTEEPRRIRLTSIERVPKQTESESDKFIGEYSVVTSPSTSEVNSPPVRPSSTGRHSQNSMPRNAALPAEVSHQVQSSVGGQRYSETAHKSEVWNVNGPGDTRRSTHATVLPSESEDTECSALPRLLGNQQGDAAPLPSPRGSEMEGGVSVDKRSTVVNTWEASNANAVMDAPDPYSSRVSESKRISALSMNGQEQRGSRSRASEGKAGQRDSTTSQMDVSEHTSRRAWEDPRGHASNARSVRSMPAEQESEPLEQGQRSRRSDRMSAARSQQRDNEKPDLIIEQGRHSQLSHHSASVRSGGQSQAKDMTSEQEYYASVPDATRSAHGPSDSASGEQPARQNSRSRSQSQPRQSSTQAEYYSQQRPSHTSAKGQVSTSSRRESHAPQTHSQLQSQLQETPSEAEYEYCSQQRPSHSQTATKGRAPTSTSSRRESHAPRLQETASDADHHQSQQRPSAQSQNSRRQHSSSNTHSHTTQAQAQAQASETPSPSEDDHYTHEHSHNHIRSHSQRQPHSQQHSPRTSFKNQETPSEPELERASHQQQHDRSRSHSHSQSHNQSQSPPRVTSTSSRRESHAVQETPSEAEYYSLCSRTNGQQSVEPRRSAHERTVAPLVEEEPEGRRSQRQASHVYNSRGTRGVVCEETPSEQELERASHQQQQQQHDPSRSRSHSQSHNQSQSPPRVTSASSRRESHAVQETHSEAEYYSLCSRTNTLANGQRSVEPRRSAHEPTVVPLLEEGPEGHRSQRQASHVYNSRGTRGVVCEDGTLEAEFHNQKESVRGSQSQAQVHAGPIPMCFEDECDEVLHNGVEEGRNSKAVRFSRRQEEVHKSTEAIPVELLDGPRVFEHNSDSEAEEEEEKLPRDTYGSKGVSRRPTPYPRHHEQPRSLSQDVESSSRGQQDSSRQLEHGYRRADCRFTSEACPLYMGVKPEPASPITFADAPPVPLCGGERARVQLLLESAHEVVEAILAPRCARESAALELPRVLQDLSSSFALHARALLESPGNPAGLDGVPAVLSLLVRLVEALDVLIAPEEETTQRGRMSRGGEAADLVSGRGCRSVDATEALLAGLGPRGFLPPCLRLLGEGDVAAKLRASGAHELAQELTLHAALALRLGLAWVPPPGNRRPCEALLSAKGHEKLVGAAGCGLGRLGAQEEDLSAGLGRLGLVLDCLRLGLRSDMCVDKLLRGKDCTGRSSRCDDCRTPVGRDKKTETQICNPVAPLAPLAVEALEQTATLKAESTAALSAATASVRLLAVLVDLPVDAGPSPPNRIACALKKLFHGQPFHPPLTSAVRQLVCCRRNSRGWFGDQGKHFSKSLRSALAAENVTGECVHAALRALGDGHFQKQPSRDGAPQSVRAEAAACGRRYILLASLYENVEAIACAVHGPGAVSEEDLTELRSLCDGERSSEGAPPPPRRSLRSNLGNLRGKIRETCLAPYIR